VDGITIHVPAAARNLVEAHGGEISADSAPGRGTRITITLPRRDV